MHGSRPKLSPRDGPVHRDARSRVGVRVGGPLVGRVRTLARVRLLGGGMRRERRRPMQPESLRWRWSAPARAAAVLGRRDLRRARRRMRRRPGVLQATVPGGWRSEKPHTRLLRWELPPTVLRGGLGPRVATALQSCMRDACRPTGRRLCIVRHAQSRVRWRDQVRVRRRSHSGLCPGLRCFAVPLRDW